MEALADMRLRRLQHASLTSAGTWLRSFECLEHSTDVLDCHATLPIDKEEPLVAKAKLKLNGRQRTGRASTFSATLSFS